MAQHLQSRTHMGTQMACPFCKRCFATATGVAHHLESASCPIARYIDRDAVYRLIRLKDPDGTISKELFTWHESDQYAATGLSWNGHAYECYFCHRDFRKLASLNQHLKSPARKELGSFASVFSTNESSTDQQDLYHCPNGSCKVNFKTLASVINHLESESCGYMRFRAVQYTIGDVLGNDGLLALRGTMYVKRAGHSPVRCFVALRVRETAANIPLPLS